MKLIPLSLCLSVSLALAACMSDSSSVGGRGENNNQQRQPAVAVKLIAFNDFHGNLETPGALSVPDPANPGKTIKVSAGGADYLAAWVKSLRDKSPNTVVVSAGDLIGASPLVSGLFHDEPTIEAMNLLGLDINAVGNHEFDDGQEELLRMQNGGCKPGSSTTCRNGGKFAGAKFKFLAANVRKSDGGTLFPAYEIKRYGNIPVAFIGMTLKGTPEIVSPTGIQGLSFQDEADTVNALVPKLKAQGVSAVVVVVHEGGYQSGSFNDCNGISGPIVDIVKKLDKAVGLVVTGHTHQAYNCVIDGRRVTSAKNYGQLFTEIDFKLDPATKGFVPGSIQAANRVVSQDIAPRADVASLIQTYQALVAPIANKVVGQASGPLTRASNAAGETTLGDVVADAQLAAGQAQGALAAFMNPGGVRADILSGGDGSVSYKQLYTVQPFGNTMMTMDLTGQQIDQLLEQQWSNPAQPKMLQVSAGFSYAWSQSAPAGSKVDIASIRINGLAVDPRQVYRVQVNNFIAGGGDGFTVLTQGANRVGGGVDVDVLVDYFQARARVDAPPLNRIVQLP
ncbi:5'-nucleotidase C-terminal domain-containing protein [Chromobacterium subtsugae]|uniref:5'-nucleotidase C-terminal domain-containing protein n=1 Tax=Chromobacterium subtsugae TaxID=251747 RepID=A0ABS7FBE5_9NEIS|nr:MULTISPECIES: bifunctional metallophosphatase/5'-nucleotidase [Chromobacterium]KUM03251.1 multifunctional 2',3'-cyclic-nucleotide 2'-phosphodiesterase/5'-nucleotidase/3'-nucleotidase [Chromobacterium subtsugae]KZE85155.1 bifunctional metallophosphatase/5'-nucleotidase [Chromobacterium sp. F49]MBW7569057.1 bifunctional metallophosphatase/5'-nucleotidase [Chromobacterium subtsugae]MBW8287400.1 5'-nucleotidase C-terminal domain-containing protein [Chromobacterium subtsugae]WSE93359.1 bifunctio